MLFILTATVWLVVVFFAFAICRLGALSDLALAEWIATSYLAKHKGVPAESPAEQFPLDPPRGVYRAMG